MIIRGGGGGEGEGGGAAAGYKEWRAMHFNV